VNNLNTRESDLGRSPKSRQELKRLGLLDRITLTSENSFIDTNLSNNRDTQRIYLDIVNKGTLRKPSNKVITKELVIRQDFNTSSVIGFRNTELISDKEDFYAEYNFNHELIGNLSFFPLNYINYTIEDNSFFNSFKNYTDENINLVRGVGSSVTGGNDSSGNEFVRISFPSGVSNTNTVSGISYRLRKNFPYLVMSSGLVSLNSNNISGKAEVRNHFRSWNNTYTSGIVTGSYPGHYLPYPNTIELQKSFKAPCPLKISTKYNYINTGDNVLHGLLIISTGNGISQKVCYVSPHEVKPITANTITFNQKSYVDSYNKTGVQNVATGINIKVLDIDSSYYSGQLFGSGITESNYSNEYVDNLYNSGISIFNQYTGETPSGALNFLNINPYKCDNNQHLYQATPLKDTAFYKFYNNLYSSSKTLSTGTWDGIIPSGAVYTIELISTKLNTYIGINKDFYIIYSGFGTNDPLDIKITTAIQDYFQQNTNLPYLDSRGRGINKTGRGFSNTLYNSIFLAKNRAKQMVFTIINNIFKKNNLTALSSRAKRLNLFIERN
jgi:hypothetical protein